MARQSSTQPTELELQILGVLWTNKECTVRQIHDRLVELRGDGYGYASTVKMLHVMLDKELVTHDDTVRPKTYRPKINQKKTQKSLLRNLIQRAYEGSTASVILQALSDKKVSKEELGRIRELIEKLESE